MGVAGSRDVAAATSRASRGVSLVPEPSPEKILAEMRTEAFGDQTGVGGARPGSEILDWMTGCLWCSSKERAVELCQLLINAGYLVQASPADEGAAPFAFDALYCVSDEDVGSPLGSPLVGQLLYTSRPGSATSGPAGSSRGAPSTARRDYSLIVIGAGPAGLAAALLASKLGARVALVDSRLPGGANVWSRHVPMRALAAAARAAYAARSAGAMGVHTGGRVTVDMEQVRAHVARAQADAYRDHSPAALAAKGIEWVQGVAAFEDAHTLLVEATETPPGTALAAALVSPRSRASLLAGGSGERAVSPGSAAASPALTHAVWPSARPHGSGAAPVPPMQLAGVVAPSLLPHAPAAEGTAAAEDALESIFEPEHAAAEQLALSARGGGGAGDGAGASPHSPGLGGVSGSGQQLSPSSVGRPHAPLGSTAPLGSAAALAGQSTFALPHLHAAPSAAGVGGPMGFRSPVAAAARSAVKTGKTRTLRGERILIAAGTSQRVPADIAGLEAVPYHTQETIFDSAFLPRRLVVVGGGPPACELAQAYSRLGSEVTIIAPALLPGEDDAVRAALRRVFFRERIQHAVGRAVRVEGTGRAPQASPFAAAPGCVGADGSAAGGLGGRSRAGSLAPTSPHSVATSPTSAAPAAGPALPGAAGCLRASPAAATARSLSPSTAAVPGLRLPSFPGRPVSPQPAQHLLAAGAPSAAALTGVVAGAMPSARARSGSIDAVSASAPIIVHTGSGDAYAADMLLVCGGREPALQALGLANAGVTLTDTRDGGCALRLSESLQTSAPHIYAAGGVTSDASCGAVGLARYASLPGGEEGERDRTVTHGSVRLTVHHSRDSDSEPPAAAPAAAGGGAGEERGQHHRHSEAAGQQHAARPHASKHNPQAAAWEGFQAARHALLPGQAAARPSPSPRVTCTEPAVASIGLTPAQALRHYGEGGVRVVTLDNEEAEPCRVDGDIHGFTSLAVLPDGRIAGATIVSARAADVASELALAMHTGATVQDIALTVHAHAGHASVLQEVAAAAATEAFLRSSKAALAAAAGHGGGGGGEGAGVVGLRH